MKSIKYTRRMIGKHPTLIAIPPVILWSLQAVVIKKAFHSLDFSAIIFPSFTFAAVYLFFYKVTFSHKRKELEELFSPKSILITVTGTILFFGYHVLLFWGLQIGPVVETNLLNFLWPLFLFLLANYLFSNHQNRNKFFYKILKKTQIVPDQSDIPELSRNRGQTYKFFIAFIGVVFLSNSKCLNFSTTTVHIGPLMGLTAAFLWALFSIFLITNGNDSHLSIIIGGSAVLSAILWCVRECPNVQDILATLEYFLFIGLFPLGIAIQCWEKAMRKKVVNKIAAVAFLIPLLSTFWLFLFDVEELNMHYLIGGILIVFSILSIKNHCIIKSEKDHVFKSV